MKGGRPLEDTKALAHKNPIYEDRMIIGLLSLSFNIITHFYEDRKNLLAAQEQLATTLEQVIANSPGHIYWKNANGAYLGCNDLQAINFNLKKGSDVVGKTDFDLCASREIAEGFRENDLHVMRMGEAVTVEEAAVINGQPVVMLSQKVPLRNKFSEIIGIIGTSIDITEIKNTQNKLKQQAEERFSGMMTLSSSIAHELRTPLTAIENGLRGLRDYVPILLDGYTQAKNANLPVGFMRAHHYEILLTLLDDLESEIHYSNTIINMILMNLKQNEISRSDLQVISISSCIDESIRRYPFKSKEAQLIHWDHVNDFLFNGNKILLTHLLFNLFKNALYFIEAEGKGEITISTEVTENYNLLYFKDTAVGIPEAVMERLFEKFYTTTINGTGLGLPFCKMVMESLGGSINCRSEHGKFAEFILSFPKITQGAV